MIDDISESFLNITCSLLYSSHILRWVPTFGNHAHSQIRLIYKEELTKFFRKDSED